MKMTCKLSMVAACVAGLATVPAAASAKEGPYIAVSGGLTLPNESANSGAFDRTVPATPDFAAIQADTSLAWQTEFDPGYALNGQVGYAFDNGVRIEIDAAFSRYDIDTHRGMTVGGTNIDAANVAVLTRGAALASNPTVGTVIANGQGRMSNFGVFGNVFYDIDTGSAFKPFVGAGIGYQWADIRFTPSGVDVANDSDGGFAYQLMAGASLALSDRAEVFGQYTWRDRIDTAEVPLNLLPATLGVETGQSIISAGVRVKLGE